MSVATRVLLSSMGWMDFYNIPGSAILDDAGFRGRELEATTSDVFKERLRQCLVETSDENIAACLGMKVGGSVGTTTDQPALFPIGPSPVKERTMHRILRPEEDALIGHMRGWCHNSGACELCFMEGQVREAKADAEFETTRLRNFAAVYTRTVRERADLTERLESMTAERDALQAYVDSIIEG